MKILESSSSRYDKGINLLSFGKMKKVYDQIDLYISPDMTVLDLGCGTGSLLLRAALKGAAVKGIDINPEMLNICRSRVKDANLENKVTLQEKGVAELSDEQSTSYDIVMSGLCFSELSNDEISFTLKEVHRLLKPEGLLIIIDEVIPTNFLKRLFHFFIRLPVILTQTTTKAVKKLPEKIQTANFTIITKQFAFLGSLMLVVAHKND